MAIWNKNRPKAKPGGSGSGIPKPRHVATKVVGTGKNGKVKRIDRKMAREVAKMNYELEKGTQNVALRKQAERQKTIRSAIHTAGANFGGQIGSGAIIRATNEKTLIDGGLSNNNSSNTPKPTPTPTENEKEEDSMSNATGRP